MADVSEQQGQSSCEPSAKCMPGQDTVQDTEAQCSKPQKDNVFKIAAGINLNPVVVLEKLCLLSGPLKVGDRFNTVLKKKVMPAPEKDMTKAEQKKKTWYDENESLSDLSISDIEISDTDELIKPQPKGETKSAQKPRGKHTSKSSSRKEGVVKEDDSIVVGSKTKGSEAPPTHPKPNVVKSESKNGSTQGADGKGARPKYESQRKNKRQHSADFSAKAKQSKVDVLAKVVPVSLPMKDTYKIEKNSNSNIRYELHLHSITTSDIGNEAFRKFMNLASDCVVQFTNNKNTGPINGSVVLYFGEPSNLQSAMQKLTQLPVLADNTWIRGAIKCVEVKPERGLEKCKGVMIAQMTFQFNSEKAEKLRQLYTYKDRRREGTKRKSAQIHRVPLAMNQEMLSLLFPFSLNVHISDVPDQQQRGVRGPVSVDFETEEWMEAVLTCFQNFVFLRSGQQAKPFYFKIFNFVPPAQEKKLVAKGSTTSLGVDTDRSKVQKPQQHVQQQREKQPAAGQPQRYKPYDRPGHDRNNQNTRMKSFGPSKQNVAERNERNVLPNILPSQVFQQQVSQHFPERTNPQMAATSNINIYQLAVSRGLDPNNKDVIKILEMSVQLEALQAARQNAEGLLKLAEQAKHTADFPVNNAWLQSAEGRREEARPFKADDRQMEDYSKAEWALKENIASKKKMLEDLEQRYKQKKSEGPSTSGRKDISGKSTHYRPGENILLASDGDKADISRNRSRNRSRSPRWSRSSSDHCKPRSSSRTDSPGRSRKEKMFRQNYEQSQSKDTGTLFFDPNRNDDPLDFNKSGSRISTEQAVKQDFDRTLEVMKDLKPSLPIKGDKSYSVEEMYLPVQFGKNAMKKTHKEIEEEKRKAQRSLEKTDWNKRDVAQLDVDFRANQRPGQGSLIKPSERWSERVGRKAGGGEEIPTRSQQVRRPQDQQHPEWKSDSGLYGFGERDYSGERQHPEAQYSGVDQTISQRNKSENIDSVRRSGHLGFSAGNAKPVAGNVRPLMGNVRPLAESTRPLAESARPVAESTRPVARNMRPVIRVNREMYASKTEFEQGWGQQSQEDVGTSEWTGRGYQNFPKHNSETVRANEEVEDYDEYQRPLAQGYDEFNSAPLDTGYGESASDYHELGSEAYNEQHTRGNRENWPNTGASSKKANSVRGRFDKRANPNPSIGLLGERPDVVPAASLIQKTPAGPTSRNTHSANYQEEYEYYDNVAPPTQYENYKQKSGLLRTPVAEDVGSKYDQRSAVPARRLQKPLQEGYYKEGENEEYYDYGQTGEGYDTTYSQTGYDQTGYDQTDYDQTGYDQTAYDQTGYDQTGYDPSASEDFNAARGRQGSFPRPAAPFRSQRGITHTRGSHTGRGGTTARGGILPPRGGTQPARGGMHPPRGGVPRGGTRPQQKSQGWKSFTPRHA